MEANVKQKEAGARAALLVGTKNDLSQFVRETMVKTLSSCLSDAIDLQLKCKQAHWNVKGPNFIALHKLFDEVYQAVAGYVDSLAERIVQLGGLAVAISRNVAMKSRLSEYPLSITSGEDHVEALSSSLSEFSKLTGEAIAEADVDGDAVTSDILTEVCRGVDQWLWFVEAHQQGKR